MSTQPISDIQEYIERSFFHRIRIECVDKDYLPDVTLYANTPAGQASWEVALKAIQVSKGFAIEVFGYASSEDRMTKKIPRIVVNSQGFLPGALGGDSSRYHQLETGGTYKALVLPPQTADYYINIHLIAQTTEQIRVLRGVLALALPRRGYINSYLPDDNSLFIRNTGFSSGDDNTEGIIEHIYSYEIPDMWETDPKTVATGIAPLAEITIEPFLENSTSQLKVASADCIVTTYTIPTQVSSTIDTALGIINVNMPPGTDVTTLVPVFAFSNLLTTADIGGIPQSSGTTPNDFTTPLVYVITAADEATTKTYTVAVTVLP